AKRGLKLNEVRNKKTRKRVFFLVGKQFTIFIKGLIYFQRDHKKNSQRVSEV
ncbi:MAG: hypothetical protein RLZZ292_185, partial [Bacteroidota bacterium]